MEILYRRGQATVAEVVDSLADPPSYSAVRACLNVLVEKGHAIHAEDGPRYVYRPAIAPDTARAAALQHLVSTFFNGSTEAAVVALLEQSDARISGEALDRLTRQVERARKEGR